jgi:hypothetical protein
MLLMVLVLPAVAAAATLADVQRQVAGRDGRTWVLTAVENQKGLVGGCLAGESYAFSAAGTVKKTTCESGRLVTRDLPWRVEGAPPQVSILVGDRRYDLAFKGQGSKAQMRWRRLLSKEGGTNDLILRPGR